MADSQVLFETLFSGLANQLEKLNLLEEEIKGFQDVYSKDYKEVNQRIDAINVQIDTTIKQAIKNIEFPKGISEAEIIELIKSNTNEIDEAQLKEELNKLINDETGKITSELLQTIKDIEIPQGEKGERGESIDDVQVQNAVSIWIDDNKDLLTGSKGDKGERGLIGQQGQIGQDGVSIEDIKRVQDDLVITLTDGTIKRIKLPKPQIQHVGGGGFHPAQAQLTQVHSTDTMMILRENVAYQVSMVNLHTFFNTPFPSNVVVGGVNVVADNINVVRSK